MLVVLTSHPIQYQAPLWRALADYKTTGLQDEGRGGGVPFQVWFLTDQGVRHTEDKDFGKAFAWDVDLLSGYPHRFLGLRGKWDLRKFNGIPLAKPIGESLREAGAAALWVEGWRFKAIWDAVSAAKKMGIPVFLRGETSDKIAEKGGVFGLVRNVALNRMFRKVDHFLAIGQASRRFYLKHGVPEGKLVDAPYCVDNEFFQRESGKIRGLKDQESRRPDEEGARSAHFESEHFDNLTDRGAQGAHFDSGNFDNLTDRQKRIREEWGISLGAKVVMFCGKFVGKKRPMDIVLAARAHFERGSFDNSTDRKQSSHPWHLLFVGSGELGDELRAACDVRFDADYRQNSDQKTKGPKDQEELGALSHRQERHQEEISSFAREDLRPPASFAGFLNQSQISKAYAVADVLVLPSEAWETWGLVVNEATAAGLPTVVSDQCGCAEDFAAKNPGTKMFPVENIPELAKAVDAALALDLSPHQIAAHADAFSPRVTAEAVARLLC